jgi:hypothetical protein
MEVAFRKTRDIAVGHWREKMIPAIKARFRQQVQDMLLLMPKQEMASLAEAIVNLTSVKRKFSAEKETEAGPIDVAIISKSDGFIWVKRKHYFTRELNPRYFVRRFADQGVIGATDGAG